MFIFAPIFSKRIKNYQFYNRLKGQILRFL